MENFFNPKVSIIIPVYNGQKYLKEAIDSAINQTYKNIEIIVVNDGSTDDSEKIALSYGNKIKYIKKENGGVSTALNLAIKNMNGSYFSWLSHDDVYLPDKIEKQIEFLNNLDNVDNIILYSNYNLIDENSKIISTEIKNHSELISKPLYSIFLGAVDGITLLIPKKAFDDCGLFDESLRCTQDYELWAKMIKSYSFIHLEDILACSRVHPNQETNLNPRVISEGNILWINMISSVDHNTKIRLEGSEYKFYLRMYDFLKTSQYYSAIKYVRKLCKKHKNDPLYDSSAFTTSLSLKSILHKTKTAFSLLLSNPKKLWTVLKSKFSSK